MTRLLPITILGLSLAAATGCGSTAIVDGQGQRLVAGNTAIALVNLHADKKVLDDVNAIHAIQNALEEVNRKIDQEDKTDGKHSGQSIGQSSSCL